MMVAERLDWMLNRLRTSNRLTVEEAVRQLGISADTARRDFDRLAAQRLARRTHGGIIGADSIRGWVPYSGFRERSQLRAAQKRRIAESALQLVQPGDTIAIDAGSTTLHLARMLESLSCTVLAYSLEIAAAALEHPQVQVFMSGGLLRRETQSAVGDESLSMLQQFQANTAFIGANALTPECDVMTPHHMEAAVKRALIAIADRAVLMLDSSKINRRALSRFAGIEDFAVIITDDGIDGEAAERMRSQGVELMVV